MKKNPRGYTIRKRKDCARYELITKKYGYQGLFKTRVAALRFLKMAYGLAPEATEY